MQESRQNHTSAASGVAYAETCGATTLSNWTEVGPKVVLTSLGLRHWAHFVGMSRRHPNPLPSVRLAEAERVGYGFVLEAEVVPNVPKKRQRRGNRNAPATAIIVNRMKETRGV